MVSPGYSTRAHYCGSPGCTRRGELEHIREEPVFAAHNCGSPGCTRRGERELTVRTTVIPTPGEPNPRNYKIEKCKVVQDHTIVQIRYSDCENYEGLKILVFTGDQTLSLLNRAEVEPHFVKDNALGLVARFVPTPEGWLMAEAFAGAWAEIARGVGRG